MGIYVLAGGPSLGWQTSGFMIKSHSKDGCLKWPSVCFLCCSSSQIFGLLLVTRWINCVFTHTKWLFSFSFFFFLVWSMLQTSPQCSDMFPDITTEMRMMRTPCPLTAWGSHLNTSILNPSDSLSLWSSLVRTLQVFFPSVSLNPLL